MKKRILPWFAAMLLLSAPALAEEASPVTAPEVPNCDFQPSCEVSPGIYGKISAPAQSKFKLSIGGFVRLDYANNSVNLGTNGFQLPSSGAIPKTLSVAGSSDQSIFSARQSRFWLKVAGPTFLGAKTGALIEGDFYGTSGNSGTENENGVFRLRHAYGTLDWAKTQILFGQTNDIFGPMTASTVDARGGQGWGIANQPRVAQIRITQRIGTPDTYLKLVVGAQNPVQDNNTNSIAALNNNPSAATLSTYGDVVNAAGQLFFVSKALGAAPGYYGLSMNNLTAGVFGLYGTGNVNNNNRRLNSYGYGVYTFVPVLKSKDGKSRALTASFEGQAYLAANMAFNYATPQAFVASGRPGAPAGDVFNRLPATNLAPAKAYGIAAQLIFYPVQDLGITTGYARRNIYNYFDYKKTVDGTGFGTDYLKSSSVLYANVAYDLNAAVRIAAEYENVNTQYGVDERASSYRTINGLPYHAVNGTGSANIGRVALFYFF